VVQEQPAPTPIPKPTTFYLLQRTSVPIEGGLKGLPAGTRLRLLDDTGHKWKLTDGENLVEIDPALLTLDEATAKAMLIEDSKARAAAIAARTAEVARAQDASQVERQKQAESIEQNALKQKSGLTGESNLLRPKL
jgi:hypothetical protein